MQKHFFIILSSLIVCPFFHKTFSQRIEDKFYAFNADWTTAKSLDHCTYFMQEIKESDTEYICRYYNQTGPMIKQETYKDAKLTIPNGQFSWYNEKGKIDSCGLVKNFKKDGRWDYFFGDSTNPTYYQEYADGKFVKQSSYNIKDTANKDDDVTIQEATFRKGKKGWITYLENNLITPDRLKTLGRGNYVVKVCFLVNKEGNVEDVYLRKSVEWSADAEIFSIIEKAPLWNPALKNGKPVYYRQVENITYVVN